jgi:DNA-binding transcriptional LysR family regulator
MIHSRLMRTEHMRRQYLNIPSEIIRTLVAISELGSISKAADRLGLSQPAISAQMKRLQSMIGGAVFVRSQKGLEFTPKGNLVLTHAKKNARSQRANISDRGR